LIARQADQIPAAHRALNPPFGSVLSVIGIHARLPAMRR